MKKLFALSLVTSVLGLGAVNAFAEQNYDASEYDTRLLKARHALSTTPDYNDDGEEQRMEDFESSDAERMEEGVFEEDTRTEKARDAFDTGDDY